MRPSASEARHQLVQRRAYMCVRVQQAVPLLSSMGGGCGATRRSGVRRRIWQITCRRQRSAGAFTLDKRVLEELSVFSATWRGMACTLRTVIDTNAPTHAAHPQCRRLQRMLYLCVSECCGSRWVALVAAVSVYRVVSFVGSLLGVVEVLSVLVE